MIKHPVDPRNSRRLLAGLVCAGAATLCPIAGAQVVFSGAGASGASIQPTVDAFRASLGALNPNAAGSFASGRREINWDGVPDAFSSPNAFPANFFNVNSPRGVVFSTPGASLQNSASAAVGSVQFGNINPTYSTLFEPFSAQRLFTAIGSNVVDVSFFVPGGAEAALSRGFGAVFSDVDLANTTSLTFFGAANQLLGTFFAQALPGNEAFSFLGVDFGTASVSRVRITSGNQSLGGNEAGGADLVVMDDFIYGEPIAAATAVPEPEVNALLIAGLGVVAWAARRRRQARA